MSSPNRQRRIDLRKKEIGRILTRLDAGDSCSVVGVGSVGKSNLLRHLLRPETLRFHLQEKSRTIRMVLVDPNNMLGALPSRGQPSAWAGYEIMVHRLYKTFHPLINELGLDREQQEKLLLAYKELHNGSNPLLPLIGLRYLELALEQVLKSVDGSDRLIEPSGESVKSEKLPLRVVFVLDEFEEMLAQLPPRFFQTLRGIRDDYKYRVMYMTFTRRPIPQIIEEEGYPADKLEPFVELFNDGTYFLGPYDRKDAVAMIENLSKRQGVNYPDSFREFLLKVSGGHAGLLRASFRLAADIPFGTPEDKALRFFMESPAIALECQTIWDSLTEDEREALRRLLSGREVNTSSAAVRLLLEKQLLKGQGAIEVNPPLFREFVRRQIAGA